jgi:putative transposase
MGVHLVWESKPEGGRMNTVMKRHRHSPEQAVRKVPEGERLLNEGRDLAEVLRHLEIAESTWNRWRTSTGA